MEIHPSSPISSVLSFETFARGRGTLIGSKGAHEAGHMR